MFTYDFIPQFATGKNRIVRFRKSRRNKQNGGELEYAQFGMQSGETYDPYSGKAAQSQKYVDIMNQYQNSKANNKANMYSDLGSALQQNFMMDNADKLKSFFNRSVLNKQMLDNMNRFVPKYVMDSETGAVTIQEPNFKTDPAQMGQGGYINTNDMYYAQGGMEVPRQEDFPDYNSFVAAMQEWEATGGYSNYMNPASMMADSIPVAQPVIGPVSVVQQQAAAAANPYQGSSVYDFLAAQNKAPDYASRKVLAGQLGIKNYRGTAAQNLQMMSMLRQDPNVLSSYTGQGQSTYAPSQGQKSMPGKAGTQNNVPQQTPPPPPEVKKALDTIASVTKNLPDSTKRKTVNSAKNASEDDFTLTDMLKVVGITGGLAGLTLGSAYLTASGSADLIEMIKENKFKLPASSQSKLIESLEVLRDNALKSGGAKAQEAVQNYNSPKESISRLRSRLAQSISNRTNAALAAAEGEEAYVNAAEKAKAEAKALRSFNAQKAAAARWGKPMPTFPKLGAAPVVAEEASGFMNTLREARMAAQETPWIRNTARFLKRMPKFQEGGEPDSIWENIFEWLDPTGISAWDDVKRSWNDPNAASWETGLEIAGAIPVFGKFGKGAKAIGTAVDAAKAASNASKASKAWKGTKKVVGTGLDWVGGSAPQRFIDQSINPLTRGMGTLVAKGVNNSPKGLQFLARGIQPFQQGQRFWKGVGDVTGQGLGTMNVPAPTNEQVNIMMPNGQIVPMSTQDAELMNLVNQNMIDTTQATGYDANTNSWKAKKGIKYKGKSYKSGGSTFSGNAWYRDGGTNNPGFRALPDFVQNQILSNMAYGGIQIDPAKRGTFKAQATRMGMGVQEAASAILNAPEGKYSPAMRKKANFAKNFAKQEGGQVLDVTPEELEMLRQQGYQFEIM